MTAAKKAKVKASKFLKSIRAARDDIANGRYKTTTYIVDPDKGTVTPAKRAQKESGR